MLWLPNDIKIGKDIIDIIRLYNKLCKSCLWLLNIDFDIKLRHFDEEKEGRASLEC